MDKDLWIGGTILGAVMLVIVGAMASDWHEHNLKHEERMKCIEMHAMSECAEVTK